MDRLRGGCRLGAPHVGHTVHDLALEVGEVDDVVVDHADRPDPGRREVEQGRRTEPAGADDENPRGAQPALTVAAEIGEQQVPGIPRALVRGQLGARGHERRTRHGATITTSPRRIPVDLVTRP